jgi:hypothetical protein
VNEPSSSGRRTTGATATATVPDDTPTTQLHQLEELLPQHTHQVHTLIPPRPAAVRALNTAVTTTDPTRRLQQHPPTAALSMKCTGGGLPDAVWDALLIELRR